ncbi:MAG TPA: FKBP-type peptidyl-prolyl cis-trans isomerase [Candidatus Babeliales bacterium]|nr:FKBP-type peptidyl-prolyl cis-trans isomerase [Candidatus Babeliales bacterium]
MKRLCLIMVIMIAPILLIGCGQPMKTEQTTSNQHEGKIQMSRTKTPSGLEYEIIKEGTGASPVVGKKVTVHYTGWLDDNGKPGTKFDSSVDRGEPFGFVIGVGYVIAGWDEGVESMKVGEKRRLFIPSKLGYGARGAGRSIPPHADLIFDVELISVG